STAYPAVPTSTTDAGTCIGPTSPFTCSGTPSVTTIPSGTLVIQVTAPGLGQIVQITAAPNPIGTCSTTSVVSPASAPGPGTFATLTYTCQAGQTVPSGTLIAGISVLASANLPVPTLAIISNNNAPVPASLAIPAPTVQSLTVGAVAAPTL